MSGPWNIIIPDRLPPPADVEARVFGALGTVTALGAKTEGELAGRIEDADAILAWHDLQWRSPLLSTLKRCRALVRVGVGFDNVDLDVARSQGIVVCNVPDYGTNDVADHAIALLVSLARGLEPYQRSAVGGQWSWGVADSFRLTGKTLGVVGLGRIGAATAMRAKAFGINVGFYDPYKPDGWDKALGLTRFRTLRELASASDIVSLHTPLTTETRDMIGREFWNHTRRGVVLINTARGPVVEWRAFSEVFSSGHVRCAGFDVIPTEPPDRTDPLIARWAASDPAVRDRLLITPHCAFYSVEALEEMRRKAAEEALRVLSGHAPWNRVN
jgi:C-terminal binding protein